MGTLSAGVSKEHILDRARVHLCLLEVLATSYWGSHIPTPRLLVGQKDGARADSETFLLSPFDSEQTRKRELAHAYAKRVVDWMANTYGGIAAADGERGPVWRAVVISFGDGFATCPNAP